MMLVKVVCIYVFIMVSLLKWYKITTVEKMRQQQHDACNQTQHMWFALHSHYRQPNTMNLHWSTRPYMRPSAKLYSHGCAQWAWTMCLWLELAGAHDGDVLHFSPSPLEAQSYVGWARFVLLFTLSYWRAWRKPGCRPWLADLRRGDGLGRRCGDGPNVAGLSSSIPGVPSKCHKGGRFIAMSSSFSIFSVFGSNFVRATSAIQVVVTNFPC
jgi:hypothetical protein